MRRCTLLERSRHRRPTPCLAASLAGVLPLVVTSSRPSSLPARLNGQMLGRLPSMTSDPPRVIRSPLYVRALIPALAVAMAVAPWLISSEDWLLQVWRWLSLPTLICAGIAYYYGARRYQTVSAEGVTEWEASVLPGRPAREVATLAWSDIEAVTLYPRGGDSGSVQFRIRGAVEGRPHTSYYPSFADPGLVNTAYILDRVPPEAVSHDVIQRLQQQAA
jgi:hypothetical protein